MKVEDLASAQKYSLSTGPFGSAISAQFFRGTGVPVIRGSNLSSEVGTRLLDEGLAFIEPDLASQFARSVARRGDLVFTCWGTIDQVGLIDGRARHDEYVVSNKQMKLTPDPKKADALYLYYYFSSDEVRESIVANSIGSSVPGFNLGQLRSMEVPLPPLDEQRAISEVLGALDDKIELNRQMNHTLEEMASVLFKSWFVDFDPVVAKVEGRKPFGMDAATAALFPDLFHSVPSWGDIPKGWSTTPLDEIADFRNGLALQNFRPEVGEPRLPVVKIAQMRTGRPDSDEWAAANIDPGCILNDGDIVFSWSGSLAVVVWCGGRSALNQHLFKVTSTRFPKWFFHQWTLHHLPEFQGIAEDKATTMGHIRRFHLTEARCVTSPVSIIEVADRQMTPWLELFIQNELESRTLASLRDTLLPKLLSGEVRLKQAEKAVEAAL